jgi:hypothetical protein
MYIQNTIKIAGRKMGHSLKNCMVFTQFNAFSHITERLGKTTSSCVYKYKITEVHPVVCWCVGCDKSEWIVCLEKTKCRRNWNIINVFRQNARWDDIQTVVQLHMKCMNYEWMANTQYFINSSLTRLFHRRICKCNFVARRRYEQKKAHINMPPKLE